MRGRLKFLISAAITLAATAIAHAQAEPAPPAPTAVDVNGVWEDVSDGRRHVQSGMQCPLYIQATETQTTPTEARRHYIPLESVGLVSSGRPRGDDVACNYRDTEGREAVINATRLKDGETSSDLFGANKAFVMTAMPDAKVVYNRAGMLDFIKYQGQGHRHMEIATFRVRVGAGDGTLALIMDQTNGWAVQVQVLDLTTNVNDFVMRTALLSVRLTDSIKSASH